MSREVGIMVNLVAGGWTPDKPETWGGSEEAAVGMAEAFAACGDKVTVYQNGSNQREWKGVSYRTREEFPDFPKLDLLISIKSPELFDCAFEAKTALFWTADANGPDTLTEERIKKIDKIVAISEYHRQEILLLNPEFKPGFVVSIPLGVRPEFRDGIIPIKRNSHQVIYASSFDRGIEPLLESWKLVGDIVPTATLHIYYGWDIFDRIAGNTKGGREYKARITKLIDETPHVVFHGRVPDPELADAFREAAIWAYPCTGGERFCLTAGKAQGLGAIPVVVPTMALGETAKYGKKSTPEQFTDTLISALQDQRWQ